LFLNTRGQRFADASSVTGFDFPSDSRALAVVDWDQDGDLDVWCSNRTSPRMRFLQNQTSQFSDNGFLAVKLTGTSSNRDAIGTRVELQLADGDDTHALFRTLRAGEGYLAQTSKWLHFGIGSASLQKMLVRWPNGEVQTFQNLPSNAHVEITQGSEKLTVIAPRPSAELPNVDGIEYAKPAPEIQIRAARRIPMPSLSLLDEYGVAVQEDFRTDGMTLLTVWASWCQPCLAELRDLESQKQRLVDANIRWLPLSVDEFDADIIERRQLVNAVLGRLQVSTPNFLATRSAVECLDATQKILVVRHQSMPVPCSFLIDERGELIVVYKGRVTAEQVVADGRRLQQVTADPRDGATPYPGRWAMNPFPQDLMAVPKQLLKIGRDLEAFDYLVRHVPRSRFEPPITPEILSSAYLLLGRRFLERRMLPQAEAALKYALEVNGQNLQARMGLADLMLLQRRAADAIAEYRRILQTDDSQPMTLNNLAWMLASTADESLRSPKEAVTLANRLCELTPHAEPTSLDTLAVALAADGQFDEAIATCQKAITIATQLGRPTERMDARLELFKQNQPYRESF